MSSSEDDINSNEDHNEPSEHDSHFSSDSEDDVGTRTEIRGELSTMSFEELMKLKEELGTKLYQEAVHGVAPSKREKKPTDFKRLNKNRPREQSSKKQVPFLGSVTRTTKTTKADVRDPRFDKNSGEYDPVKFKENYKFLKGVREKEIKTLQQKLTATKDESEKKEIKFVMQRLKNKNVEETRWQEKQNMLKEERQDIQKAKSEGRQPHYVTKKERRAKELVKQFEQLKSSGSLAKHLEKKRKKNAAKDRKKLKFD